MHVGSLRVRGGRVALRAHAVRTRASSSRSQSNAAGTPSPDDSRGDRPPPPLRRSKAAAGVLVAAAAVAFAASASSSSVQVPLPTLWRGWLTPRLPTLPSPAAVVTSLAYIAAIFLIVAGAHRLGGPPAGDAASLTCAMAPIALFEPMVSPCIFGIAVSAYHRNRRAQRRWTLAMVGVLAGSVLHYTKHRWFHPLVEFVGRVLSTATLGM